MSDTDEIITNTFAAAMLLAQSKLRNPPKNRTATVKHRGGGQHMYKYADLADVNSAIVPVLNECGLFVTQFTSVSAHADPFIILHTVITHAKTGKHEKGSFPVCVASLPPQEVGSAMTYARRYALCAAVNITAEEDLDGSEGGPRMSKQGGRALFDVLQEELRSVLLGNNPEDITAWIADNADRMRIIPQDWELLLMSDARTAYKRQKAAEDLDRNETGEDENVECQ